MKHCIHGRSEKQKCRLCNLRSTCCNAPILKINLNEGIYRCESCNKKCSTYKEIVKL